jgi:pyruvate kinase
VPASWLDALEIGDEVILEDLRGKKRVWSIASRLSKTEMLASCPASAYLAPGIKLKVRGKPSTHRVVIGAYSAPPVTLRVFRDDVLLLARSPTPGQPAQHDESGKVAMPAFIPCSEPRVFDFLARGHAVWIDDGRIGAVVERVDQHGAWLRITQARPKGERIAPAKGLNFPDSTIALPALSQEDAFCLDFAVANADLVGYSFVQNAADMELLIAELARRDGGRLGIIAKIETRAAVKNLPEIIVHGAGRHPFGVMIARGDLAVEIGYERMAEIQEEILWLCEAAHVPVVWATQVLESLVKEALPSRAEMTDAAMAERAECVMLNKGPYLLEALQVLDDVVTRMAHHQQKKTAQYRALHW